MPFDLFMQQALLNWCTGAGAAVRPTGRFLGFESGSPQYSASSGAPVFRSTATFQAASTIAGSSFASVTLSKAYTLSPASSSCTVFGWAVYNSTSGGSRLIYGTLSSTHSMLSGSGVAFGASSLTITLA